MYGIIEATGSAALLRTDRYILREMAAPFVGGTLLFVAVILANTIIQAGDEIFQRQASWQNILAWLFYRLPFILTVSLPVGAMLATSLTMIRLGRDNEITPLRLGGMSVRRLFVPFYLMGLAISLLALADAELLTPPALARSNALLSRVIMQQGEAVIEPNATFRAGGETFCHVSRVDLKRAEMDFVLVYRFDHGRPAEALCAPRGVRVDGQWQLQRGQHSWFDAEGRLARCEPFETYPVAFAQNLVELWDKDKDPEQLTIRELRRRLSLALATGDRLNAVSLRYFLATKFAMPLSCLVFTLLAAPLSLRFARPQTSPFLGLLLTIIVVFFANGTINYARTIALSGPNTWLGPGLAAWAHVGIFGALAALLIWRAER